MTYPHKCRECGSPAQDLFMSTECTKPGCKNYVAPKAGTVAAPPLLAWNEFSFYTLKSSPTLQGGLTPGPGTLVVPAAVQKPTIFQIGDRVKVTLKGLISFGRSGHVIANLQHGIHVRLDGEAITRVYMETSLGHEGAPVPLSPAFQIGDAVTVNDIGNFDHGLHGEVVALNPDPSYPAYEVLVRNPNGNTGSASYSAHELLPGHVSVLKNAMIPPANFQPGDRVQINAPGFQHNQFSGTVLRAAANRWGFYIVEVPLMGRVVEYTLPWTNLIKIL